jgi:hypothetical protein
MNVLKRLTFLALAGVVSLHSVKAQTETCPSWGPYIEGINLQNVEEVIYSEVMVDNGCKKVNTYFSTLNFSLGPRGGYAGIQYKQNEVYNNIFSVWDIQDSHAPQCTSEYAAPNTFVDGFGGEGTGLHTDNTMPWTPGVWYATVVRRWNTGDGKTHIGFFMYDYGTQKWTHYSTIVTPENNVKFQGNNISGFLENFNTGYSKDTRCGYWRNMWGMDNTGTWSKPAYYKASAGTGSWSAEAAFNNTAVKVTSCGTVSGPASGQVTFTLNQTGTKPSTIIPVGVNTVTPTYSNGSVNVTWTTNDLTSPQLSYTVSLYSQASWNNSYTPIATVTGIRPDTRSVSVPLPAGATSGQYYVSVVLKDIFNQTSNFGYNSLNVTATAPTAFYRIKNVASNQYVTPSNFATTAGTGLVQQPFNASQAQQWKLETVGNNTVIVNRASGLAIDVPASNVTSGTNLVQYTKHSGTNQQWILKPYTGGSYVIFTALSNSKAFDNPGSSATAGTNVNLWDQDFNGTAGANHQWILEPVSTTMSSTFKMEPKEEKATLYPNPVKQGQNITLVLPEIKEGNYVLKITDTKGAAVTTMQTAGGQVVIPTAGLRSGMYFYNAQNADKRFNGKFVVETNGSN